MDLTSVVLCSAPILLICAYYLKLKLSFWNKYPLYHYTTKLYNQHKDKPIIGFVLPLIPFALCIDLDFIKQVLVRDFDAFADRGMFVNEDADPLSAHMFSVNGNKWKKLRSSLSPTFSSAKMKLMFPLVQEKAENLKKMFRQCKVIDSQEFFARYTTDVIASCAFGIESNSIEEENSEFRAMGRKYFAQPRHSAAILFAMMFFRKLAARLNMSMTLDDVTNFFLKVVRDTIDYRRENKVDRPDFMSLLMKIMHKDGAKSDDPELFSFNEVAAQAFVFYLAGFETSSTLLTFCTYELAKNVELQEKVRQHVNEVLQRHNGEFTYEALMDMKYLDQVLNESLRKYPPLTDLFRMTTREYTLDDIDLTIPKETNVFIPVYAIHHDENIYPDPDRFDPDRFSEEEVKNRHPMAFLPFGEGPRNCIGLRFGLMQARIALVTLLTNFSFSFNPKTKLPLQMDPKSFILKPLNTIYFDLESIKT